MDARGLVWLVVMSGVMLLTGCSSTARRGADLSGFGAFEAMTKTVDAVEASSLPRTVALAVVEHGQTADGSEPVMKLVRPVAAWRKELERRTRLRDWVQTFWLRESTLLRTARDVVDAAALQGADVVLVMTFNSSARGWGGSLSLITLGLFPDATTTGDLSAEAVLVDARDGRVLDRWRAADTGWQPANLWTAREASEQVRGRMERRAVSRAVAHLEEWIAAGRGESLPADADGWVSSSGSDDPVD